MVTVGKSASPMDPMGNTPCLYEQKEWFPMRAGGTYAWVCIFFADFLLDDDGYWETNKLLTGHKKLPIFFDDCVFHTPVTESMNQ